MKRIVNIVIKWRVPILALIVLGLITGLLVCWFSPNLTVDTKLLFSLLAAIILTGFVTIEAVVRQRWTQGKLVRLEKDFVALRSEMREFHDVIPGMLNVQVHRISERVRDIEKDFNQDLARSSETTSAQISRSERRLKEYVYSQSVRNSIDVVSFIRLTDRIHDFGKFPELSSWAMSPSGLLQISKLVQDKQPKQILELGSGYSTLVIADAIRKLKGTKFTSVDHHDGYLEQTRSNLEGAGLAKFVSLELAPLAPLELPDWQGQWYSLDVFTQATEIDLLLIDGPPGASSKLARYPALQVIESKLADECVIVIDDAEREEEKEIVKRYIEDPRITILDSFSSRVKILRFSRAGS